MSCLIAFAQKVEHEKKVEEEVQKAREEAEHQKRLKEEEERIRAAQEVRERGVAFRLKRKRRNL